MVFSVSKEKPVPLDTIIRTTEHVIKQQFGWQCCQDAGGLDGSGCITLRNVASVALMEPQGLRGEVPGECRLLNTGRAQCGDIGDVKY